MLYKIKKSVVMAKSKSNLLSTQLVRNMIYAKSTHKTYSHCLNHFKTSNQGKAFTKIKVVKEPAK